MSYGVSIIYLLVRNLYLTAGLFLEEQRLNLKYARSTFDIYIVVFTFSLSQDWYRLVLLVCASRLGSGGGRTAGVMDGISGSVGRGRNEKKVATACDIEALRKCLEENKGDHTKCETHLSILGREADSHQRLLVELAASCDGGEPLGGGRAWLVRQGQVPFLLGSKRD
jgi:hypothetical protein